MTSRCLMLLLTLFFFHCQGTPPYKTSHIPERIVLSWSADPATTMDMTWRTDAVVARPVVEVAPATGNAEFATAAQSLAAGCDTVRIDGNIKAYYYTAQVRDLAPATLYGYRVGDGETWSEWSQFRTADSTEAAFRFLYLGDAQNDLKAGWSRAVRAAYAKAPDARFMLHGGDLVNTSQDDNGWDEWFYAAGWIPRLMPQLAAAGNHEHPRTASTGFLPGSLTPLWRPQFSFPLNGLPGLEETCYYLDYQGLRLIVLNGTRDQQAQAHWLEMLLRQNTMTWTIVTIHQPMYSVAKDRDDPELRALFVPIFDRYAVDLVLQGHDHVYARSYKIRGGRRVADDQPGTVYVVSVSGPKMYASNRLHEALMARMSEQVQLYQIISLEEQRLRFESWSITGELNDAFDMQKMQ